jgi:hypothetical protein
LLACIARTSAVVSGLPPSAQWPTLHLVDHHPSDLTHGLALDRETMASVSFVTICFF